MSVYFISRHPGARQWLAEEGIAVDEHLAHLEPGRLAPGDLVIGNLGIQQVAALQARGVRYQHLCLDLEPEERGVELTPAEMRARGARLEAYEVRSLAPAAPLAEDAPRLFIGVVTGQQVANLPPILELAEPGDKVLWLESELARERDWSAGGDRILERAGLDVVGTVLVEDLNDPVAVARQVREAVARYPDHQLYVVGNGGQKLSPVGIMDGCRDRDPVLVYGDNQPIRLRVFPRGLKASPEQRIYTRHGLDLREILAMRGYRFMKDTRPERIWPGNGPALEENSDYGEDPEVTARMHREHDQWHRENPDVDPKKMPAELGHLGDAFEQAAARRLHGWLQRWSPAAQALQAVYKDVHICKEKNPGEEVAQWDIVLVLRNGILLYIECKSFTFGKKDLDARWLNLQQASSQLARMVVCAPVYGRFQEENWFRRAGGLRDAIGRLGRLSTGFGFLPFDLPGEPQAVDWRAERGSKTFPVFEDALKDLLKSYVP